MRFDHRASVLHLAERCIIVGDQKQLSAITDGASGALPARERTV